MLPGLTCTTTHAAPPSRKPSFQLFSHMPLTSVLPNVRVLAPSTPHQLHCMFCRSGGGVDQRHSAVARCLADLITTHTSTKVYIEQSIPGLTHYTRTGQIEGARMDIVVELHGNTYFIDTAIVCPLSSNAELLSAASGRPGHMAKREEKTKFARYPRVNLVPFILESTGRPGYHARKFIKHLYEDADHPPNHPTQQHLQTTTPGGHHVTALTTASPPTATCSSTLRGTFLSCEPLSPYQLRSHALHESPVCYSLLSVQCPGFPPCRPSHHHKRVPAHWEHQSLPRRH